MAVTGQSRARRCRPKRFCPWATADLSEASNQGPASKQNPRRKQWNFEELVAAAEEAIAAVVAAEDGDATEEVVARAKRLREFTDEANTDDEQARGKRAEEAPADETEEEKKEVEEVRSLARSYGKLKEINDLRKLGTRSAELKVAMRGFIASGATVTPVDVKPAAQQRSAAPVIDTTKIYARANGMFKGRK